MSAEVGRLRKLLADKDKELEGEADRVRAVFRRYLDGECTWADADDVANGKWPYG